MPTFKRGKSWYADYTVDGKRRMKSFGRQKKTAELFFLEIRNLKKRETGFPGRIGEPAVTPFPGMNARQHPLDILPFYVSQKLQNQKSGRRGSRVAHSYAVGHAGKT